MRSKKFIGKISIGLVLTLVLSLQCGILVFAETTELKDENIDTIGTVTADDSESEEVADITVEGTGENVEVNVDNVVLDEDGDSVSLSGTYTDGTPFVDGASEGQVDNGMHLEATGTNVIKQLIVGTEDNANPFILIVNVQDTASTLLVNSLKVKSDWYIGTSGSTRLTCDSMNTLDGFREYINALFFKSVQPEERIAVAKIEEKHEESKQEEQNSNVNEYQEALIPIQTLGSVNGGSPLIVSDMDEQTKSTMAASVLTYASNLGKEVQNVLVAKFVQAPIGFVEGQTNTIRMAVTGAAAGDNIVVAIYNPLTGKTEYIEATVLTDGSIEFSTAYMGYMTIFTVK